MSESSFSLPCEGGEGRILKVKPQEDPEHK